MHRFVDTHILIKQPLLPFVSLLSLPSKERKSGGAIRNGDLKLDRRSLLRSLCVHSSLGMQRRRPSPSPSWDSTAAPISTVRISRAKTANLSRIDPSIHRMSRAGLAAQGFVTVPCLPEKLRTCQQQRRSLGCVIPPSSESMPAGETFSAISV